VILNRKMVMINVIRNNSRVIKFMILCILSIVGVYHILGLRLFTCFAITFCVYCVIVKNKQLRGTRFRDWVNPLKWGSVLFAVFTKWLFPMHILEQILLRVYDVECRKCVLRGSCIHCGCDMSKVYTPFDSCSEGNWGPMIEDEGKYKRMRDEYPVDITVRYLKEGS